MRMLETSGPLIQLQGVGLVLPGGKTIVSDINLSISGGETLGLVGPSGSGKSTIGRMVLGLTTPTAGTILYRGQQLHTSRGVIAQELRRDVQMVFQNPLVAFNPRRQIGESIELPTRNFGIGNQSERSSRIGELLTMVGLEPRFAMRYPHELSGGQCQRAGIARALASSPKFIFLDEPLSALDVSVQAQVANLLKDLQASLGLTYLFVANNLLMARFMSDRVAILQSGRVIESGPVDQVFENPTQQFTSRLLAASLSARHTASPITPASQNSQNFQNPQGQISL
jgi:ABC-type oligopeptide transport system ATPase subunit